MRDSFLTGRRGLVVLALGSLAAGRLLRRRLAPHAPGSEPSPGTTNWSPHERPEPSLREARSMF